MKEPLVSVVMPSYNSEKHIAESIQSIINQTFTNWEFIIVDGHSRDRTIEIIESFIAKDSRIKLLYDEGMGIGPALNIGCEAARGKYIARMDADDVSSPQRFENQISYLEKHEDVGLVSCIAELIDDCDNFLGYRLSYTNPKLIKVNPSLIFHPGVVMRKVSYMEAGGYPPLKRAEDLFLWHRMLKKCGFYVLGMPLLKYRVSNTALSSSMTTEFKDNVNRLWRDIAVKDNPTKKDFEYLNDYINENIVENPNIGKPVRTLENKLINLLRTFLTLEKSIRIVLFLKNTYGLCKFREKD